MYRDPHCTRCPLYLGAKTVCVSGRGDPMSRVMIVGEAPGAEEDARGLPFVGPSGQMLDTALKEVGLQGAFIVNAVRCRPPNNATPTESEIDACRIYLAWDIWRCSPIAILALGNVALQALTGKRGITKARGKWHMMEPYLAAESLSVPVFATYHPAYLLRKRNEMQTWADDFVEFARYVDSHQTVTVEEESSFKNDD